MPTYAEMGKEELTTLKTALTEEYETYRKYPIKASNPVAYL